MQKQSIIAGLCLAALTTATPAKADEASHTHHSQTRADDHAPIGVMGDHLHKKGEWMFSYRAMHMDMEGNLIGKNNVSPEFITNNIMTNGGMTRVVPTKMTMGMHMLGAMLAPSDNITLMAMLPIHNKEMDHITFDMGNPNLRIGTFTTKARGIGDLRLSGLIGLYDDGTTKVHFNAGLSAPSGSIRRQDEVLTPGGMTTTLRLPYAMQLGTGTWDLLPGLTVQSRRGDISFGAQYMARFHLGENSENYSWGDKHELTAWAAYQWAPWISTSLRVKAMTQDTINGRDLKIAAPVQTADPDNYGGERIDLYGGINLAIPNGALQGHRFALEVGAPIYQDLNGPQMETGLTVTVGWQKAF